MVTRNNYEEYFLLYIDNELSPAERKAVELFVQQNTDLQKELMMLQQTTLNPEKIFFEGKESLLKQVVTEGSVNHKNYEEYFLLYTDNELDEAAKKQVEEFVSQNISLQEEFALYLQTKVSPDTNIFYKNKEELYKKEEEKKRFILPWYKISAAAIVLVIAGFLVFTKTKKSSDNITATNTNVAAPIDTLHHKNQGENKKDNIAVTIPVIDSLHSKDGLPKQSLAENSNKKEMNVEQNIRKVIAPVKNSNQQIARTGVMPVKNKIDVKHDAPDPSVAQNENNKAVDVAVVNTQAKNVDIIPANDNKATGKNTVSKVPDDVLMVANNDISDDPENNSFSSSQEDAPKKNKMRGFLRKVSRVFEKTANAGNTDGSNKVLIGGFQIAQR